MKTVQYCVNVWKIMGEHGRIIPTSMWGSCMFLKSTGYKGDLSYICNLLFLQKKKVGIRTKGNKAKY